MNFFEFVPEGAKDCKVQAWIHAYDEAEIEQRLRPAIVICPGGAYRMVSKREAEPVALPFFAAGYDTFILEYSVLGKAKNFEPLCQLAATFAHIRKYADEWMIDREKIAVCGFSAGGHLAASLGILHNEDAFLKVFGSGENIRPDAMILGYPVITADAYAHAESIEHVSGAKCGSKEYEWFGLDKHVDSNTPPAFVWHTAEDKTVPVENSLKLSMAFSAAGVPFELHILPHGMHGMSVCTKEVGKVSPERLESNHRWVKWSIAWLNELFEFQL